MRTQETAAPVVSVVIPFTKGNDLSPVVNSLRAQTLGRWEAVIVGAEVPFEQRKLLGGDERFVLIEAMGRHDFESINLGLERARGEYITVLETRDDIAPYALSTLIEAARIAGTDGAFGRYVFASPLGLMPGDPLAGVPAVVGHAELAVCKLFPLNAMVARRSVIGSARLTMPAGRGGDHAFLLRLASAGVHFAFCDARVALAGMEAPRGATEIAQVLSDHARVIDGALCEAGRSGERDAVLASHGEALILLRMFMDDMEREGALVAAVTFGNLFAQWWQRLRFLGNPPRHALAASGGTDLATAVSRERIARGLLEQCVRGTPVVLLGLGRNARVVARELHALGMPIFGRDDGLTGAPVWAAEEGVNVEVIAKDRPFEAHAQYIMTVGDDAVFMKRLPQGLKVIRWSEGARATAAAWISQAVRALLNGTLTVEPPAPTRGLYARIPAEQHAAAGMGRQERRGKEMES